MGAALSSPRKARFWEGSGRPILYGSLGELAVAMDTAH